METLIEKYKNKIKGILSCFDRILIKGTLPGFCYAEGMSSYLTANNIRIFDYPRFAEPLRNEIRKNAENIAKENDLEIEHLRRKSSRKEKIIKKIIKKRGNHPGLVHIFSAMEPCPSYKPWKNRKTGHVYLIPNDAKCLHYYFYFIDEELGLCYVCVPTWCPFTLQIYFNGHNLLASKLRKAGIGYELAENAFINIDDFYKAQQLIDDLKVKIIHDLLDSFAERYCPVIKHFNICYHWSLAQVEYATDILFEKKEDLQAIYGNLTRTAIHTVKPENIATFLSRKFNGNYQGEMGNNFNIRIEGTRIKHSMGPVSIKMYDKFGLILRIETTVNNVTFFKHYRRVEHRNGSSSMKMAQMKKGIYSLSALSGFLFVANHRYLAFISTFDDTSLGIGKLNKISKSIVKKNRPYKGFNFFDYDDQKLFEAIASGEFNIYGFQNKNLRQKLNGFTRSQVSRLLKRLRVHGLIKRVGRTYKYYLTTLGRQVIATGLKAKELFIIPKLSEHFEI